MKSLFAIFFVICIALSTAQECTFQMMTGDVTATEAYFQATLREPACRKNLASNKAIARVQVSKRRNFKKLKLSRSIRTQRYAGRDVRVRPGEFVARVHLYGLKPATNYYYRFFDEYGNASPIGIIRTLRGKKDPREVHFLHMSCANIAPYPIAGALRNYIKKKKPQFNIFNGDVVYADRVWYNAEQPISNTNRCCRFPNQTQSYYYNLYAEQREDAYAGEGFYESLYTLPTFMMWDDHEVTDDFAGNYNEPRILFRNPITDEVIEDISTADARLYAKFGRRAFYTMNALPTSGRLFRETGVRVFNSRRRQFRSFMVGKDVEIFILDTRSYRAPLDYVDIRVPVKPQGVADNFSCVAPGKSDTICSQLEGKEFISDFRTRNANKTFLGDGQRKWLKRGLKKSTAKFKFLISSVVMLEFFYNPPDRWEAYWNERQELLGFIEKNNIENVIILTGDYHASIFSQVNPGKTPPVYEFTTGSVGNLMRQVGDDRQFYDWLTTYGGNGHLFPEGQKPVKYMMATEPNFMSVRVKKGVLTIQTINSTGEISYDFGGTKGEFKIR